ncbi:MAG: hypothetical protein IPN69_19325 [Acidobacteria bacterium]|nr:hypothetical protein [Acidobacteriota bacterium]
MSLEACTELKEKLSEVLLTPGGAADVFGVGVGIARICEGEDVVGANYSLRLYTSAPIGMRTRELAASILGIDFASGELPVQIRHNGEQVRLERVNAKAPKLTSAVARHGPKCSTAAPNELRSGSQISLGNGPQGTLGFYVVNADGDVCVLSCSHVIAANGNGLNGAGIFSGERFVAELIESESNVVRFGETTNSAGKRIYATNHIDAALGKLASGVKPTASMRSYWSTKLRIAGKFPDERNGRTDPRQSYRVTKHGHYSCETGGWIDDVDCDFIMSDENGTAACKFVKQFRVIRTDKPNKYVPGQNSTFSVEGDSGALVFDNHKTNGHRAVGMLIGAGNQKDYRRAAPFDRNLTKTGDDYSVVTPISTIISKLNVSLLKQSAPSGS